MSLDILVAVDIVEDQVVRLRQGELKERTVYGHDPVETALEWEEAGAKWLHVVDLDGATRGDARNSQAVEEILTKAKVNVQVGGGIRTVKAVENWMAKGAARVCIGTKSFDPVFLDEVIEEFGDRIVVAIDARAGRVQVAGWQETVGATTLDAVKRMAESGVRRIMFTDIERDGTLLGPNFDAIEEVLEEVDVPVIASGGISSAHDVRRLVELEAKGLEGMIIGKALYSGALSLEEAEAALKRS